VRRLSRGQTLKGREALFGPADAQMEAIGYRLGPREGTTLEAYQASVRSRLGEEAWDEALTEGRVMGPDEAIEYASQERSIRNEASRFYVGATIGFHTRA
jgi:hypothetical protein